MYRETCWCSSSPQKNPLFPSLRVPTYFSWSKFHNFFMTFQGPSTSFFLVPFAWRFSNISNSNSVQTWFQVAGIFAEGGGMQRENVRDISKTSPKQHIRATLHRQLQKVNLLLRDIAWKVIHKRLQWQFQQNFHDFFKPFNYFDYLQDLFQAWKTWLWNSISFPGCPWPWEPCTLSPMSQWNDSSVQFCSTCKFATSSFFLKAWLKSIIFTFKWNVSVWGLNPTLPVNRRSVEEKEPESQERVKVFSLLLLWMAAESDGAPA